MTAHEARPVVLGGYAAKSCARVTHNQWDLTVPRPPEPTVDDELQRLFDLGIAHETAVYAIWLAIGDDVVDLTALDDEGMKTEHIAASLEALEQRRAVVLGGRLPDDLAGGRTGKPDVLIRDDAGGYHPADVKAHLVLDKKKTDGFVADLRNPALRSSVSDVLGVRHKPLDLMQLAHYWRMLEACGHSAALPWGAIIGNDPGELPRLAWYDLTAPAHVTFSRSAGKKSRSSLERYDHEHDFRIQVANVARRRTGHPSDPDPLVQPIGQKECAQCVWAPVCVDLLPDDDVSRHLGGALSVREYLALREQGVTSLDDLADLDVEEVLASSYLDETSHQHSRAARLYKAHMSAQLARDGVVLRLKQDAALDLPERTVEVDIDMESTRDGCVYLWGALVTVGSVSAYHAFGSPTVTTEEAELVATRECFDWLVRNYRTATVFHYSHVEKSMTTRILGADLVDYEDTVADSSSWVDLLPLAKACLDSRSGHGLKVVAVHGAGYAWRDEDPGGLQSQRWLESAADGDADAWQRILDYNEDDVRATLAVRRFLRAAVPAA